MAAPTERLRERDASAREEALDPRRSFIVQAPAGSGKTELLVRRFLSLLAVARRPESILAITFTRKAAGEMRDRILGALRAARDSATGSSHEGTDSAVGPPIAPFVLRRLELARRVLERSEAEGWDLLDNPGRLQVYTIDSLCARIVGATPLLSRTGGSPETTEEARPYVREAARRVLARAGDGSDLGNAADLLLRRAEMRSRRVEAQIVDMLERRDQWAAGVLDAKDGPAVALERFELRMQELMAQEISASSVVLGEKVMEEIGAVARMTWSLAEEAGRQVSWKTLGTGAELSSRIDSAPAWRDAAELLLTGGKALRKEVTIVHGAKSGTEAKERFVALLETIEGRADRDAVVEALRDLLVLPESPRFDDDGRAGLLALFRVLLAAYAELWHVFREARRVDFIEVEARATSALGDSQRPSALLQGLDTVIDHILVDEFQDTSRGQCNLLRALMSAWSRGEPRSLFLVGDPMQSVYRFRKAEVGLFLHAADSDADPLFETVDLEPLELRVNFRSTASVIDWVNATFAKIMGDRDDLDRGLVRYAPCAAAPEAVAGPAVESWMWEMGGFRKEDEAEAEGLAELLETELIEDARKSGGEGRVAVLVRNRGHAALLLQALRRRGVRYSAEGLDTLADRPTIIDLQSLTRTVVHRADRLSALALLHSPLVGLTDDGLCRLVEPTVAAHPNRPPSIGEVMAEEASRSRLTGAERERLEIARNVIGEARALRGRQPLDMIVRSAWTRLGGPQLVGDAEGADAERFFALLLELDRGGAVDLDELGRRLGRLEATADASPEVGVEVLTVHKSKGLEFDTVVLPGLGRTGRGADDPPMVLDTHPTTGEMLCCAPRGERGKESLDDLKFAFLARREGLRERAEELRLLYVGATRAQRRLVLSTGCRLTTGDDPRPYAGSRLSQLWPALAEQFDAGRREADASSGRGVVTRERVKLDWLRDPSADRPAALRLRRTERKRPSDAAEGEKAGSEVIDPPESEDERDWTASRRSLAVGDVVHACLERIAEEGLAVWTKARLDEERAAIERGLRAAGVALADLRGAASEVEAAIRSMLADERGRWMLDAHQGARSEYRLTEFDAGDDEDRVTEAVIDRTFEHEGVRWIIDYKTDRPREGEAADAFKTRKLKDHRAQLEGYAKVLAAMAPGVPIRIGLYFPLLAGDRFIDEKTAG